MESSAVTAVTPVFENKLQKKVYQNWLKVGLALGITCKGIRPYIDREIQKYHGFLLTKLAAAPACPCHPAVRGGHVKTCLWARELASHHLRGKPTWQQSDSTKWKDPNLGPWEVAKLYMPSLGGRVAACVDAATTDPTGLLNVLYWCDFFKAQKAVVDAVRETRNVWGHAAEQELLEHEANDAISSFKNLLKDPELLLDPNAEDALKKIKDLENRDMISFDELDLKVIKDLVSSFKEDIVAKLDELSETRSEEDLQLLTKIIELNNTIEQLRSNFPATHDTQEHRIYYYPIMSAALFLVARTIALFFYSKPSKHLLIIFFLAVVLVVTLDKGDSDRGCDAIASFHGSVNPKEFDFTDYLVSKNEGFLGRRWLLEKVSNASKGKGNKGIIITGDPGSGKTSFIANVICSQFSSYSMNIRVLGYHMCISSYRSTKEPAKFVRSVAAMISSVIKEYSYITLNNIYIQQKLDTCVNDPVDCFDQVVLSPLRHILDPPSNQMFLVVDALDECILETGRKNEIVELLSKTLDQFPSWVKVLLTSQKVPSILTEFSSPHVSLVEIEQDNPNNLYDIEQYVSHKLYEQSTVWSRMVSFLTGNTDERISSLIKRSEGNFLYIKVMLEYMQTEKLQGPEQINDVPKSVHRIYMSYLKRHFTEEEFVPVRRILEVLVAAYEPLLTTDLYHVIRAKNQSSDSNYYYDILRTLDRLSMFLHFSRQRKTVQVFHSSLSVWLTSNETLGGPFYVNRSNGHQSLAEYFLSVVEKNSQRFGYRLGFYLANHIFEGGTIAKHKGRFLALPSELLNSSDSTTNMTALHFAVSTSNTGVIGLLANHFSTVDCLDRNSRTPAFIAASTGQKNILAILFQKGANLFHVTNSLSKKHQQRAKNPVKDCKRLMCGYSLLHAAAQGGHVETVKFLLNHKLSKDAESGAGNTPMQIAAQYGRVSVMEVLHKHGAPCDARPLRSAAAGGHLPAVRFLHQAGVSDECVPCKYSISPSYMKQRVGKLVDDEYLWRCETALHIASAMEQPDIVSYILRSNDTALTCYDYLGMRPLHKAVVYNSIKSLKAFLEYGVSPLSRCAPAEVLSTYPEDKYKNIADYFEPCICRYNALHLAARHGRVNMIATLLEYGAKTEVLDACGSQAVHVAACYDQVGVLSLLVAEYKVDVNSRDLIGKTPFHYAVKCKAAGALKRLFKLGANIHAEDDEGNKAHYVFEDLQDAILVDPYVENREDKIKLSSEKIDGIISKAFPKHLISFSIIKLYIKTKINMSVIHRVFEVTEVEENFYFSQGRSMSCLLLGTNKPMETSPLVLFSTTAMFIFHVDSHISALIRRRLLNVPGLVPLGRRAPSTALNLMGIQLNCTFLVSAVRSNYVYVVEVLLSAGMDVNCHEDKTGDTPLLTYLRTGGRNMAKVLTKYNMEIDIKCGEYFVDSVLHLSLYHKLHYLHYLGLALPDDTLILLNNILFDYLLFDFREYNNGVKNATILNGIGPVLKAINAHPDGDQVINKCFDIEGFSPFQRAVQGANLLAVTQLVNAHNADLWSCTEDGKSPLLLSVWYAIKYRPYLNLHEPSLITNLEIKLASHTAKFLLTKMIKTKPVPIGCNRRSKDLTIYHVAASRCMSDFVNFLLTLSKFTKYLRDIDQDCVTQHGITPFYLASLYAGDVGNVQEQLCYVTMRNILAYGGKHDVYPSYTTEFFLLFNAIFNTFPDEKLQIPVKLKHLRQLRSSFESTECLMLQCLDLKTLQRNLPTFITQDALAFFNGLKRLDLFLKDKAEDIDFIHKLNVLESVGHCVKRKPPAPESTKPENPKPEDIKCKRMVQIPDMCAPESQIVFQHLALESDEYFQTFFEKYTSFMRTLRKEVQFVEDKEELIKLNSTIFCLWRSKMLAFVKLRFMLSNLDFWQKQIKKNLVFPSFSTNTRYRLKRILIDVTDDELIDIVTILIKGEASRMFNYLRALQLPKAPLYKETLKPKK
ncbi:uncharacterized protein LOC5509013 [Nematostella vectensis]|uniref:uncharacterized protein LOC5509013 n=1 Tax=Nematostella vectensis TaxID=45351 RepID=UPI002077156B|nr:uncharacterized protein LOC5509013 [Nematostella vectensis]XP_048580899.1 uncharacterized protein LOC5509013 [Nematostella vectensis]